MRGVWIIAIAMAVAATVVSGGAARAQSSMVNGVPVSEFEMGAAFWYANSKKFGVNLFDNTGAKLSQLDFSGASAVTLEVNFKLSSLSTGLWLRGMGGGGINFGGNLVDQDFVDSLGYSNTSSKLGGSQTPYYFGADIGWNPWFTDRWPVKVAPFLGIFYNSDQFLANSLSCNVVNVNTGCPSLGASPYVSPGADVIRNTVTFWGPRVGLSASYPITPRFSINAEGDYLFIGQYKNVDNHLVRGVDFTDRGSNGSGYQFQASVDYKFADSGWNVGAGYRWWHFESGRAGTDGYDTYSTNKLDVSGFFGRANYAF
jgi:outer membrane protease